MKIISLILLLMALTAASARADNNATEALGDSCMKINDTFNAMRYYGEALQTDSSDAIKEKMAHCLFMRGEYRKCASMLEATARKGTDSLTAETMRRLFDCYRYMDNTAKQIEWGKELLNRCPMDGIVTAYMARIYNSDDNISSPQKAYDITAKYMQTDSTCLPVMREYADANFLMRDYGKAIMLTTGCLNWATLPTTRSTRSAWPTCRRAKTLWHADGSPRQPKKARCKMRDAFTGSASYVLTWTAWPRALIIWKNQSN